MSKGIVDEKQVLSEILVGKSLTAVTTFNPKEKAFVSLALSWGWFIGEYEQHTVYSHLGGNLRACTLICRLFQVSKSASLC